MGIASEPLGNLAGVGRGVFFVREPLDLRLSIPICYDLVKTIVGKFQPRNMDIQHPTLRLMHRCITMTLFSRQDIRVVHNTEMQILYGMIKKIKIAPVKEIFRHWLGLLKLFSTSISCTSLVTRIATSAGAMED